MAQHSRVLLACALVCLTLVAVDVAAAPVTIDTVTVNAGDAAVLAHSHPVDAAGRLLLVAVQFVDSSAASQSVTYGGVPLSLVGAVTHSAARPRIELWQLFSPPVGTAEVQVTIAGGLSARAAVAALTLSGADPGRPIDTCITKAANSASGSIVIESEEGDLVLSQAMSLAEGPSLPSVGAVELWSVELEGGQFGAGCYKAGGNSVNVGWAYSELENWVALAANINHLNFSPVIAPIGDIVMAEGELLELEVAASDEDGTIPGLRAAEMPEGGKFKDNGDGTGAFEFTSSQVGAGIYTVLFIASDEQLADTEVVTITVGAVNVAPELEDIKPQSVALGNTLSIDISATDADSSAIVLSAVPALANAVLTDNGDGTGEYVFLPDVSQIGLHLVTFVASDGLLADSEVVQISVVDTTVLAFVRIELESGEIAGDTALTTDDSLSLYCRGYTADSTLLGDVAVDWSVSGVDSIAAVFSGSTASAVLNFVRPGTGRVVAVYTADHCDTTALITCSAGLPSRLEISPDGDTLDIGDIVQFTVTAFDADSNVTDAGQLTWQSTGHIGGIDPTGLFVASQPGIGHVAVATDRSSAAVTSGLIVIQAVYVSPLVLGSTIVHAGDDNLVMLAFSIGNYYESAKTVTSLTVRNSSRGGGTVEQVAGNIDSVALYIDRDMSHDVSLWDTLIAEAPWGEDPLYSSLCSLTIEPGAGHEAIILVVGGVGDYPRDGDSLDFCVLPATDVTLADVTVAGGPDTVNSRGYHLVDGMIAGQIGVSGGVQDTISWQDGSVRVLSIDIPRDGYLPDRLMSLSVSNYGSATAADVDSLMLYADNGDGIWDGGAGDGYAAKLEYSGNWWSRSDLDVPLDSQITRFYVVAAASRFANRGATLQLGVPEYGLAVASRNDGPLDEPILPVDTITIMSERELSVSVASLPGGSLVWGELSAPLVSLQLVNHSGLPTNVDSLTLTCYAVDPAGASQEQLDAQFDSLLLFHDLDGIASTISPADTFIGSVVLADGRGTIATAGFLLPGGNGSVRLAVAAAVSDHSARNGNTVRIGLGAGDDLYCSPTIAVAGDFPAINATGFTITGFPAASVSLLPCGDLEYAGGQVNGSVFRFTLPGNGYASDTLMALRLVNQGTLPDGEALPAVRLWRDVTGDGYSPDDVRLADLARVGSEWVAGGIGAPIPPSGMSLVVTADVTAQAFRAGTFSPTIPVAGVTYRSGLNGPDDAVVTSLDPILIMPADRITVISLSESGAAVSPGQDNVPVLAFALYNGYSSDKSLSGLGLYNLTKTAGTAEHTDQELGQVRLYEDSRATRLIDSSTLIATGFFSDGYLGLDGFESYLPSESLSYFFVTANLDINAIDADTLIVAVPNAADLNFAELLSVNGDLPLVAGRPAVVDGSVAAQYDVLPQLSRTIRPGDTAQMLMAFRPARNGATTDWLTELSVSVAGAAGATDLTSMRLWMDRNGDDQWQPADSLLGTMAFSGDRWTLAGLNLSVGTTPPVIFVLADVSSSAASGQILEAAVPVNGCTYVSGNDGPRDEPLSAGASFVVYASRLQVAGLDMRTSYSLGESIPVGFTVQNHFATPLTDVVGEVVLQGDSTAVRFDSSSAPVTLAPGGSAELTWYFTALQIGQVAWTVRAVAPGLPDSSAFIAISPVQIQAQPTAAEVSLINSVPASVTKGRRNVFPLTICVGHPDTGAFTAALRLDGVRLTVRDASGGLQPANQVFSRMALGADFSNYAVAYPVPSTTSVTLLFAKPVIVQPRVETQLALLVDIDSSSVANSFVLSLDGADALLMHDNNNGLPVPIRAEGGFPMSTAACRVDVPSRFLAVSGLQVEDRPINRGQADAVVAGLRLRHPGGTDGSPIQLTELTVAFVDAADNPLLASTVVSQLALRSSGTEWAAVSGPSLYADRLAIKLSSPLTLGPGESRSLDVVCAVGSSATAAGFRVIVSDSTCLLVREIGSGATLPAATDAEVMSTSSAFPILGGLIDINAPAVPPEVCLTPGLTSSVAAGTDSVTLLDFRAIYPECPDCSPLQIEGILVRALDSSGVPLDPQRVFDRVGVEVSDSAAWYQPYVELVNGDVHFRLGESGLRLQPGDTVSVRLMADIESQCPYDNLVLVIDADDHVAVQDAADSTHQPGLAAEAACQLVFPLRVGPAAIIQPAGQPNVSSEDGAVLVAYQGQSDVPLLELAIDYSQLALQGDLQLDGLSGRIFKRTQAGFEAIEAAKLLSGVSLWIEDSLVWSGPVAAGMPVGVSLPDAFRIASGSELRMVLKGDIGPAAERSNYRFVLEDSSAIALVDPMLGVPVYPLAAGSVFPLNGVELSVTGGTLQESFTNYPNPFVASRGEGTTIAYVLPEAAQIDIAIFTITGELVVDLVSGGQKSAGEHQADRWFGVNGNGRAVVPGTYICQIRVRYVSGKEETLERKVAVIR